MKNVILFLLSGTVLLAQQPTQLEPDCVIPFVFTGTSGTSTPFDNRFAGCSIWTLEYSATNAATVSIGMQSALDNGNTPGTFAAFGSVLTNTLYAALTVPGLVPWMEVSGTFTYNSAPPSGQIRGTVLGWRPGPDASSGDPPSGGGVTSVSAGTGLTASPNPIIGTGTISLSTPVLPGNGGTGVSNTATLTLGTANQNWATLGTGIVKNTTGTGGLSLAAAADVYGLWGGTCSSTTYLNGAGNCATPSGSGTITGVTAGTNLSGGGSSGSVTLNVVNGPSFSALSSVNASGGSLPTPETGALFQIANTSGTSSRYEADGIQATGYFSSVRLQGTVASPTGLTSGLEIGGYNSFGYDGSAYVGPQASYRTYASQNWAHGSALGTYISLAATPLSSTTLTEVMRLQSGVMVPGSVAGGDPGAGSINISGSYLINNVPLPTVSGTSTYETAVYAGTATLTGVAPSSTSGIPYVSQGASSYPTFGTCVIAGGCTGATSAAQALINLFPTASEEGDTLYWSGSAWVKFAGNTSGTGVYTQSSAGLPGWIALGTTGSDIVQLSSGALPAVSATNLTNLPITLTTTGSSGAATYTQSTNTLNIPQYSGGGGSTAWSSITNPSANLALSMAGYTTTFDQTSAVNWLWANTTTATSGTTNASPVINLAANYYTGSASAADTWTAGTSLAAGTNGASTLTIAHSGSTGTALVSAPAFQATSVTDTGVTSQEFLGTNSSGLIEASPNIAANTVVGNNTSSTAAPSAQTSVNVSGEVTGQGGVCSGSSCPSVTAGTGGLWICPEGTNPSSGFPASSYDGLVCNSSNHEIEISNNNGSLAPLVSGPTSSTNNYIATWNGTAGNALASTSLASLLVSPPAIGGTTPAAGSFTTLSASGNLTTNITGSTQCVEANSSGVLSGTGSTCGSGGGGVSSFSGDGTLLSNSGSTGAVTATLANAAANTVWGNDTSSSAGPGYQTSINVSGTITAQTSMAVGTSTPSCTGGSALCFTETSAATGLASGQDGIFSVSGTGLEIANNGGSLAPLVSGPTSSTNNYVATWNGTAGKALNSALGYGTTGNSVLLETSSGGTIASSVLPAISFDKSSTGLVNPTADATFTYIASSTSGLTLAGTAPSSSSSAGTAATTLFQVNGVTGGATTGSATTAGVGSAPSLTAGNGGSGSGGTNAIGGAGGGLTFTGGAGGASGGTAVNSNGGGFTFVPGAAGTGGSGTAGIGGNMVLQGTPPAKNSTALFLAQPSGTSTTSFNSLGTYIGVDAPSSYTGDLMNLIGNGGSSFKVTYNGSVTTAAGLTVGTNLTVATINNTSGNQLQLAGHNNTVQIATISGQNYTGANPTLQVGGSGSGSYTGSSGVQNPLQIAATYDQTSTAGATDLIINRTETAVGSGNQRLWDAQVGSTSQMYLDHKGGLVSTGTVPTVSGCGTPTPTGGAINGTFAAGATSCTVTLTLATTAPNGWNCSLVDRSTGTGTTLMNTSGSSTTAVFPTFTAVSSDTIAYMCMAY